MICCRYYREREHGGDGPVGIISDAHSPCWDHIETYKLANLMRRWFVMNSEIVVMVRYTVESTESMMTGTGVSNTNQRC